MSDHWTVTDEDLERAGLEWHSDRSNAECLRAALQSVLDRKLAWMPMDSAPKDGTPICGWLPEWEERAALRWLFTPEWAGWVYTESVLNDMLDSELEPTHWLPQLDPPK